MKQPREIIMEECDTPETTWKQMRAGGRGREVGKGACAHVFFHVCAVGACAARAGERDTCNYACASVLDARNTYLCNRRSAGLLRYGAP